MGKYDQPFLVCAFEAVKKTLIFSFFSANFGQKTWLEMLELAALKLSEVKELTFLRMYDVSPFTFMSL